MAARMGISYSRRATLSGSSGLGSGHSQASHSLDQRSRAKLAAHEI